MVTRVMLLLALLLIVSALAATAQPIASYEAWSKYKAQVQIDRSVVGLYTFEDTTAEKPEAANLRAPGNVLSFDLAPKAGAEPQKLEVVPGRWPNKQAVRLDMGRMQTEPFPIMGKSFTATCWFRKNGFGVHRGNGEGTNGTIISQGTGYFDGWRVTTSYPDLRTNFEIGRPQGSTGTGGGACPDGVWEHLAASWDGKLMRLYLNGLLVSQSEYGGEYTAPTSDKRFRIGFAGYGWGSVKLDVDEVVLYNRALPADEILRAAYVAWDLPGQVIEELVAADEAYQRRDFAAAAKGYAAIMKAKLPAGLRSLALLRLAQISMDQGQPAEALQSATQLAQMADAPEANKAAAQGLFLRLAREGGGSLLSRSVYEDILKMPGITADDAVNAHVQIGHALRREGKLKEAQAEYDTALSLEGIKPVERLNIMLSVAHGLRGDRQFAAAREGYVAVAADPAAPAAMKIIALFGVADSYVGERKWDAAKAELDKVRKIAEAPAHLQQEARARQADLVALKAGKQPSPADDRMKLPAEPKPAVTLYVAPNGDDANAGTLEKPLATLQKARDLIRAAKQGGVLPAGGAKVYLRGGVYPAAAAVELTAEDTGSTEAPIIYRAYREEKPVFRGLKTLTGFKPVTDAAVLARLPEESRGKVLQLDLKANGVSDYAMIGNHGYGVGAIPQTEVFWNGKALTLARWPNEGFVRLQAVVSGGKNGSSDPATFTYAEDRPARWTQARDFLLDGFWQWDWAESTVGPIELKATQKTMTIPKPPSYGVRAGQRFFALNLLEEIDRPGEYYLDRATGMLYVFASSDAGQALVEIVTMSAPFVKMKDCSYVTLQGFTFDGTRTNGIVVEGGSHNLLAGCTVSRVAMDGVVMSGSPDSGLFGCDITMTGRGGVTMSAGDRKTLTPGNDFIENCHLYDFSRIDRSYTPAVLMNGVGNRVVHNLIHESPHHAMRIEGNDHLIAYNEVHSVVLEGDDQAGVDMWGNPSYRGNRFLYNFWHHIGSGVACGQAGIRLDDAISGVLIYGNIFYKTSEANFGGVQIHGGKENIIDNCIFVDCKYGLSFSSWGQKRWEEFLAGRQAQLYEEIDITKPPYSTRYPELARLTENEGVNFVWRNIAFGVGQFLTRDRGVQQVVDDYITAGDPGFVDKSKLNFQLEPDSPALRETEFRRIPFESIGLYQDALRASWPVKSEVSPNYQPEKRGE
jgi:hypothetical protein